MGQIIEGLYQDYLKMVKLPESSMSPVQRVETRRAFFGACGVLLQYQHDIIALIEDDDEGAKALRELNEEVGVFWKNELARVGGK